MNWSPFSDWCHEPCPGGQQEDDLDLSEIPGSCVSADGTTQAQGTLTPPGLGAQGLSRDREAKPLHDVINVWKGLGEGERNRTFWSEWFPEVALSSVSRSTFGVSDWCLEQTLQMQDGVTEHISARLKWSCWLCSVHYTHLAGKAGVWYGSGLYGREISQQLTLESGSSQENT